MKKQKVITCQCGKIFNSSYAYGMHLKNSIRCQRTPMKNITINLPKNYDKNIQKLKRLKVIPSRSEAVRLALKEYLQKELGVNIKLLEAKKPEGKFICTVNVHESHIEAIDTLLEHPFYISRSEVVRIAVREFLVKKLKILNKNIEFEEHQFELKEKDLIEIPMEKRDENNNLIKVFKTYKVRRLENPND